MALELSNPMAAAGEASLWSRFSLVARDIKLSHSVFALPFAILATFMARPAEMRWKAFSGVLAIVVLCMVLARTWAMLINRLADREIDRENPRTAGRAFASGRLSARFGLALAACLGLCFVGAASLFWLFMGNPWPALLAIPVLLWIGAYSFTKRFTWACHLFLGGALALSPIAAAIAINPALIGLPIAPGREVAPPNPGSGTAIWCLAGMVVLWVAGFDIIYSLQDVEADKGQRLYSVPSRLGIGPAIWLSRIFHAGAFALLVLAWRSDPRFGAMFGAGLAVIAALLVCEHVVLARRGKAGLDAAFFTMNGLVSLAAGLMGVADVAWLQGS